MGMILSRFHKKKTTIEILEDLDKKIKDIERYGHITEQKHKRIVGTLILYSAILYIITAFVFYLCFFPASLYDQIFYIIPLLIFPILILLTKKLVTWYYKRKISENEEKLSSMQIEKKKILDDVTETETYKKAKEILLKFAPDQLKITSLSPQPTFRVSTPMETSLKARQNMPQNISPLSSSGEMRKRVITSQNQSLNTQSGMPTNAGLVPVGAAPIRNTPVTPFQSGVRPTVPAMAYRSPLPRPVLPRQRNYLDRLVEYIVGDGPSSRYALICKHCESHNGMALKEEFEYLGFRCCYCNFWNPARKQKPSAQKLEFCATPQQNSSLLGTPEHVPAATNSESVKHTQIESSSPSDTDSDIEVIERPTEISEDTEHTTAQIKKKCDESDTEEVNTEETNTEEAYTDINTVEANKRDESVEKMDIDESFS
ncbi:endoplasmic reticulum junction formation protein lunapark-A [Colletes gigas]|uniref:endoplasmic reticulum junction formation protein lunapark-A n=1 Tax=Colletes gigas TaxID=935657 RepID=UPI001C9B7CBB|nr:endoplasmic reticulum junction formation protein lunapark-A [Colletes gigas]